MGRLNDLTGKTFERLEVIKRDTEKNSRYAYWICACSCGAIKSIRGTSLTDGSTLSCGCYGREVGLSKGSEALIKHGQTGTRLYRIWNAMKRRTTKPNDISYPLYGGRGIRVCAEWYNDFSVFKEWADKNGYIDNLSIDRINPDGNYEPSNCRWSTVTKQANNRRKNHFLTHDGKTMTIAEWSVVTGIDPRLISLRLRRGWTIKRALTEGRRATA